MKNNGSELGAAANTGTRINSNELRPRGPNQAINRRLRQSSRVPARETINAIGRINSTAAAKTNIGQLATRKPFQISELPNSTKVKSSAISAVVWPYSRKQSHSSTSSAAIVKPAAKAARNPLPCTPPLPREPKTPHPKNRATHSRAHPVLRRIISSAPIASNPTARPAPGPSRNKSNPMRANSL